MSGHRKRDTATSRREDRVGQEQLALDTFGDAGSVLNLREVAPVERHPRVERHHFVQQVSRVSVRSRSGQPPETTHQ